MRRMSAAIQLFGRPCPEKRPWTITKSPSATITPGSYFSVAGALLIRLQDLLYQEKRAAHVGCEEIVKVLDRMIPDRRTLADPRVAHKHVQSPAADRANLFCQRCCAIGRCQVRPDRLRPSAFCTDAVDQRCRLLRGAAIVDEDMRPGLRKRRGCRTTNSP